jgi:site-specific recombinase XerD
MGLSLIALSLFFYQGVAMMYSASKQNSTKLPQVSLKKLLHEYKLDLEAANRSPKTISRYIYTLSGLADFLESNGIAKPVSELGRKDISAYVRHLQNSGKWSNRVNNGKNPGKLSPYTVQGHVRDFKAFWSWLTREGYVEKNVLAGFPLPKVPQYLIKTLTCDHIKKLFSAIDRSTALGARYYCILMLLLDTGMRISELVKIKMNDVDFTQGLITIFGKGQRERVVPFSRWTRKELARYINNSRSYLYCKDSSYLFPAVNREFISMNSVQQFMRRLAKKADLDGIKCSPHIFRHTFATQAIANEANVFAVKDIMGHASLQTTMKYTHLKLSDLKTQHNKFSPVESLMKPRS